MKLERFTGDLDQALARQVSVELQDLWQPRFVRELTDNELLTALCEAKAGTRYKAAVESELRRREAWAAPARLALAFSILAFVLATAALAISLIGPDRAAEAVRALL